MKKNSLYKAWVVVFALILFLGVRGLKAEEQSFGIQGVEGEVLHAIDGKEPLALKNGDIVTGGRLVTLDEGTAKIKFPNGQEFQVPPHSVLFLDPKCATLDDACAAAAAIRDPSVLFIQPLKNGKIPVGKEFQAVIGIYLENALLKDVSKVTLQAAPIGESRLTELASFDLPKPQKSADGKPRFDMVKVKVLKTPEKPGDYELFLKTVETPSGKKFGKPLSVSFVKP